MVYLGRGAHIGNTLPISSVGNTLPSSGRSSLRVMCERVMRTVALSQQAAAITRNSSGSA
jgi:hypothetical protein